MPRNNLPMEKVFEVAKFARANKDRLVGVGYKNAADIISNEIGFKITDHNVRAVCQAAKFNFEIASYRPTPKTAPASADHVRALASVFADYLKSRNEPIPPALRAMCAGQQATFVPLIP